MKYSCGKWYGNGLLSLTMPHDFDENEIRILSKSMVAINCIPIISDHVRNSFGPFIYTYNKSTNKTKLTLLAQVDFFCSPKKSITQWSISYDHVQLSWKSMQHESAYTFDFHISSYLKSLNLHISFCNLNVQNCQFQ